MVAKKLSNGSKVARREAAGVPKTLVSELLNFFYPMHYRIGMDLETVMCQGQISRKQAAILWLIHTRSSEDGWVRRKEIENRLATWFEISNSNISKLLRELSKPPLSLVSQVENPESGREKVIRLTETGERFVAGMIDASVDYLAGQLSHVTESELRWGVDFLALAFRKASRAARLRQEVPHLDLPPGRIAGIAVDA
ncbi:MarR family winged helix-turn-helix transcriptional regulator [Thauera propionica]|uniref:MarR family winged helix-turn-helix transcriptional regulator n=1 Tax=Thauera propionica TaxID=2019431 RepID=UPI0023F1B62E|nr:MarR family winged helix-turn-helix transcriptional regulator [Thauera propionica]